MEQNFDVDISLDDVMKQNENEMTKKGNNSNFDPKNYLDAHLAANETTKKLTIRLLPFSKDGGSPFMKIKIHNAKVDPLISQNGSKIFICPSTNGKNERCPFCETSRKAFELMEKESDPVKKEQLKKVGSKNHSQDMWIVRCIDRDHEEDGPKFWRFFSSSKHKGIYDQIIGIMKARADEAAEVSETCNIFSLKDGKDLVITISRGEDGKQIFSIVDKSRSTPLSNDVDTMMKWINDEKSWEDVFKVKTYDYLEVILNGGIPFYNQETKKFEPRMTKEEYEKKKDTEAKENLAQIADGMDAAPVSVENSSNQPLEDKVDNTSEMKPKLYVEENNEDKSDELPF